MTKRQTQRRGDAKSQTGKSQRQSRKGKVAEAQKVAEERPQMLEWTTGTWKGLPRWQCELCPWDTLEGEEAMKEHIRAVHTPRPPRKVALPLVDAKGKLIMVEAEESDGAD